MFLNNVVDSFIRDRKVDKDWVRQLSHLTARQINRAYFDLLREEFFRGLGSSGWQHEPSVIVAASDLQRYSEAQVERLLHNAEKTILHLMERHQDQEGLRRHLQHAIDSLGWRADFFHRNIIRKAHIWGKAHALRLSGNIHLQVVPTAAGAGCSTCAANANRSINTKAMMLRDLPPYHSNCLCDIQPLQEQLQ